MNKYKVVLLDNSEVIVLARFYETHKDTGNLHFYGKDSLNIASFSRESWLYVTQITETSDKE